VPQGVALDRMLADKGLQIDAVIGLDVPDGVVRDRIVQRRSCPKCGAVYHLTKLPPKVADTCDRCGSRGLEQRSDDTLEKVNARLEKFHKETAPLIQVYGPRGLVKTVDGMGTPDEVFQSALSLLGIAKKPAAKKPAAKKPAAKKPAAKKPAAKKPAAKKPVSKKKIRSTSKAKPAAKRTARAGSSSKKNKKAARRR
jgi:cell division septation protein DedD